MIDPDEIPGYREALAWEAERRSEAFLGVPHFVAGVEILPLTLHRMAVLVAAASPFFCGGPATPESVAIFLWVVSPQFEFGDDEARAIFLAELRAGEVLADLGACVGQVRDFLDEMFLDAPTAGGSPTTATTSPEAVFVELFADAYGWMPATTLHLPLPQLYQILRKLTSRRNPRAVFINRRSTKVRGAWLRAHVAAVAVADSLSELAEQAGRDPDGDGQEDD